MKHQVILGPPGTGKTRYLVDQVREHNQNVQSSHILFCSHTRAAATEAMQRWGTPNIQGVMRISTLHSFCFEQIGAARDQTVDDVKLGPFLDQFGLDTQEGGEGKKYLEIMSYARAHGIEPLASYDRYHNPPGTRGHFQAFVISYNDWKNEFGYLDFNDMLTRYFTVPRGTNLSLMAVDEAQDLTPLQWQVIRRIMDLNKECQVMVAGDADQCIYGYMGADPSGMHSFHNEHDGQYHTLDQSHRVPKVIYQLAQRVINRVKSRISVLYFPRPVTGFINNLPDTGHLAIEVNKDRDTLILYNDKFIRSQVEEELQTGLIPYHASSGMPAPLQTKAGKALVQARFNDSHQLSQHELDVIRVGLNNNGISIWNTVGPYTVIDQLRNGRMDLLRIHPPHLDYLSNVDPHTKVKVRISTIHGAKGTEATDVHLLLEQSRAAIDYSFVDPDAQHRLFYVAVTRAKESLITYEGGINNYEL